MPATPPKGAQRPRVRPSGGAVEFKLFTDRSHFICNQDGWESVAAFVLDWVAALTGQACAPG